jgi:hypothetical protein
MKYAEGLDDALSRTEAEICKVITEMAGGVSSTDSNRHAMAIRGIFDQLVESILKEAANTAEAKFNQMIFARESQASMRSISPPNHPGRY